MHIIFGKASLKLSKFNYKKILDINNAFLKFIILKSIYIISNYKLDIKFNQDRYVFQRNLNYKIIAYNTIYIKKLLYIYRKLKILKMEKNRDRHNNVKQSQNTYQL